MNYTAQQFKAVRAWEVSLGSLAVPKRETAENGQRYVLLNGTTGNFCLDFLGGVETGVQRNEAWSCDVGHYVTCVNDTVIVNRWDKKLGDEVYSLRSVVSKIHEFHQHLEKTSPDRSLSIAPHVLRVFGQIRTVLEEQSNALRSLRVLLHLFASLAADVPRLDKDFDLWGLTPEIANASEDITVATWMPLYDELSGIGRSDDLRPNIDLMLRHCSGTVFQEAHVEAELYAMRSLPGMERPVKVSPRAVPSEAGIYFTPPSLARTLAQEATRDVKPADDASELVLFDPACGSGELLKECLRLLSLQKYTGRIRVIGWDKSASAVDMAGFVLAWEKRNWPDAQIKIEIVLQDSLAAAQWPQNVDILIMNPPFRSWLRMTPEEQQAVIRITGASYRPNLAIAFAHLALTSLNQRGTLAMITPNSLFEASSGKAVRAALSDVLAPHLIARLGEQTVFARALVDAGIYVGRRNNGADSTVLWVGSRANSLNRALRGLRKWRAVDGEPIADESYSVYRRGDIGKSQAPWVAREYKSWITYNSIKNTRRTVPAKKLFDIRLGVRLGNDAFVVSKEYVGKLAKTEQRFFRPAVMNLSISDAKLNDDYYVFYRHSEGLPEISTREELEQHVPTYFREILLPAKPKLETRKTLARANMNWWELLEHRAWLREHRAKIVSKYFGKGRSFAFDKTGEYVVVVGSAWLLNKGAVDIDVTDDEIYFALLTYLSSSTTENLLKYVSIQVSGGQWDLSNKYLETLPVLDFAKLAKSEPDKFSNLVQTGMRICAGSVDCWSEIDELVTSILNG
jgi:hypothetical protein